MQQIYVGPDSARVQALIKQHGENQSFAAIQALVNSAIALGCEPLLLPHFRVIRRLADYCFFNAGGVLIGTHAFLAYGNMLGVRWSDASRTQASSLRLRCQAILRSMCARRSNPCSLDFCRY